MEEEDMLRLSQIIWYMNRVIMMLSLKMLQYFTSYCILSYYYKTNLFLDVVKHKMIPLHPGRVVCQILTD